MPKKMKPAIFVFCEGESEMEYTSFLKDRFRDVVAIQKPVKGTFDKAKANFSNRINQLNEVIRVMKRVENTLDAKQILSVIEKYSVALALLCDKKP